MPRFGEIEVDFDPERLLDAIALVESNGGHNNHPRFEGAFAPPNSLFTIQGRLQRGTGRNFNSIVERRWAQYGLRSACSYGPHQILYHTAADLGYRGPPEALSDPTTNAEWAWLLLRKLVERGARTIEQVADGWNSGSFKDGFVPHEYINKVLAAYHRLGTPDGLQT